MKKLESKIQSLSRYLNGTSIMATIQNVRGQLQTMLQAKELGLIGEHELDDILDKIDDLLDKIDDWLDKVCHYIEKITDNIWDWIKDLPDDKLEDLLYFLHFWIHNVEIPCDGSKTIIICGIEYHIYDIINCCIMG